MRALAISLAGRWLSLCLAGGDQLDVDQSHRAGVFAAPEPAIGKHGAAGVRGRELKDSVAFFSGLGADQVIADRHAFAVTQQHQAHPPYELAFRRAVAVAGVPSELAVRRTPRIVRAGDQRSVGEADLSFGDQLSHHQLHRRDPRRQTPQPAVVLSLVR